MTASRKYFGALGSLQIMQDGRYGGVKTNKNNIFELVNLWILSIKGNQIIYVVLTKEKKRCKI